MQAPVCLDVQYNCRCEQLPAREEIRQWIEVALRQRTRPSEVSVRIVDAEESRTLNNTYRRRDRPTNVLSFPADLPEDLDLPLLGDLVVCAPVVIAEAREQGKSSTAHWAHMIIHGTLHLLGYDHQNETEACIMESLEAQLLEGLGFADPYTEILKCENTTAIADGSRV